MILRFSVWRRPLKCQWEVIQPSTPIQCVQFLTLGETELQKRIGLYFRFPAGKSPSPNEAYGRAFGMQCENNDTSVWSYYIYGCTKAQLNSQFLYNVPRDKVKHWTVTKTFTHLNVTCNDVTVLNFNFATDHSTGFENSCQMWMRNHSFVSFSTPFPENILLLSQVT